MKLHKLDTVKGRAYPEIINHWLKFECSYVCSCNFII